MNYDDDFGQVNFSSSNLGEVDLLTGSPRNTPWCGTEPRPPMFKKTEDEPNPFGDLRPICPDIQPVDCLHQSSRKDWDRFDL